MSEPSSIVWVKVGNHLHEARIVGQVDSQFYVQWTTRGDQQLVDASRVNFRLPARTRQAPIRYHGNDRDVTTKSHAKHAKRTSQLILSSANVKKKKIEATQNDANEAADDEGIHGQDFPAGSRSTDEKSGIDDTLPFTTQATSLTYVDGRETAAVEAEVMKSGSEIGAYKRNAGKRANETSEESNGATNSFLDNGISGTEKIDKLDHFCLWSIQRLCRQKFKSKIPGFKSRTLEVSRNIADFFLFIYERQSIWERRNSGQNEPWTQNFILQQFSFCNVYRELDRGTAFLHAHILKLFSMRSSSVSTVWTRREWLETVLWASYSYRLFNRIETFLRFDFPKIEQSHSFVAKCRKYKNSCIDGPKLFSKAHQTTNLNNLAWYFKQVTTNEATLLKSVVDELLCNTCLFDCCRTLQRLPGVAAFYAWQILCDLKESNCSPSFDDDDTFCELGPGAVAGMGTIFSGKSKWDYNDFLKLVDHQNDVYESLGLAFPCWKGRRLTVKEVEHALCEFFKYQRLATARKKGNQTFSARRYYSQAWMDDDKPCQVCQQKDLSEIFLCDTCLGAFCGGCILEKEKISVSFICKACCAFETISSDVGRFQPVF